jgi:hypothetical protein
VAEKWNEIEVEVKGPESIKPVEVEETKPDAVSQVEEVEQETPAEVGGLKVRGEAEGAEDEEAEAVAGVDTKRAEKRIRKLVRQKREIRQQLEGELAEKNEKLTALEARLKAIEENQTRSQEAQAVNYERQLSEREAAAKQAWQAAFDAGDKEEMLAANDRLFEAKAEKQRLADWKRQKVAAPKTAERAVEQRTEVEEDAAEAAPAIAPKAQQWIGKQKWWGKDKILTAATVAIAGELEADGFDPNDDDYYTEVEKRLKAELPGKFATPAASRPAQVVAGQSRSPAPNKVRLNEEDQRIAKLYGLSLEDYARSKQETETASGGYVPVQIRTR